MFAVRLYRIQFAIHIQNTRQIEACWKRIEPFFFFARFALMKILN